MHLPTPDLRSALAGAALVVCAGTAHGQDFVIDDELAAQIQQDILLLPNYGEGSDTDISVQAEDGRLTLTGIVNSNQAFEAIDRLLREREGLDMDDVDNNIVMQ